MNAKTEDIVWRKLQERNDFAKSQKECGQGADVPTGHQGKAGRREATGWLPRN